MALVALAPGGVRAQSLGDAEGRPVGSVRYDPPDPQHDAAADAGLQAGAPVTAAVVREAIRQLWRLHRYSDVRVYLDRRADGRVDVLFRTVPILRLESLELSGGRSLGREDVARGMAFRPDREVTPEELPSIEAAVERTYAERGFGAARASARIVPTAEPGRVVLAVRVEEGPPVLLASIRFEGALAIDREAVAEGFIVHRDDPYDQLRVRRGLERVRALYRSLGYHDATIDDPLPITRPDGRIDLAIPVRPGPRYEILFEGSLRARRPDLREALDLDRERGLSDAVIGTLEDRLVEWYRQRGFRTARVSAVRRIDRSGRTATLSFRIVEGRQVRVRQLVFSGNEHFDDEFLREQVWSFLEEKIPASLFFQPIDLDALDDLGVSGRPGPGSGEWNRPPPIRVSAREVFDEEIYKDAVDHLVELYRADGFLGVVVDPPVVVERDDEARVTIRVHEGPRTMIAEVRYVGNRALTTADLARATELRTGEPLSQRLAEEALSKLEELYANEGYLFARIERTVLTSQDGARARVTFTIVEGRRVRITSILIRGNELTNPSLVRDRLTFVAGDTYRPREAERSRERLMSLGIFRSVTIEPLDPEVEDSDKAVVVTVRERSTQYVDLRAGGSTGEGLRFGLEYGYRNLFGWALTLTLRAEFSYQVLFPDEDFETEFHDLPLGDQLERRFIVGFALPSTPAAPFLSTGLQISHQRQNELTFGYTTLGALVTVTTSVLRPFTPRLDLGVETADLGIFGQDEKALNDYLQAHPGDLRLRRLLRLPTGQSAVGVVGSSLALDLRDNPFTPSRGFFGSVTGELVNSLTTAVSEFIKVSTVLSGFVPIGSGDVVVAVSGRVGRIFHLDARSQTFQNRRFFLGGTDTIRGFPEESLIPQDVADEAKRQAEEDPEADPVPVNPGGDAFVTMRGEVRFPIFGGFAGGLFVDTGNLWSTAENAFSPFSLRTAVGAGVRYITPVGALALDYGLNLEPRRFGALDEPSGAVHFSVGLF